MAALAAWTASAASASAHVTVTINYDFVETRVSPRQEVHRAHMSETYKLSTDKGVDFSGSQGVTARAKLGESMTGMTESGETSTSIYRIVNGVVVITTHNPGYFHVLKITTDGRTACSATKRFFRNPGHQYYEALTADGKERIMATKFIAENLTCSIRE